MSDLASSFSDVPSTSIACLGDANDPQAWSSIPHHILQEGRRLGVIQAGVKLDVEAGWVSRSRKLWNLFHLLSGHRPGGFQYSPGFLNRLWGGQLEALRGQNVISTFQLLPPALVADGTTRHWFYLDGTLQQLVDYYGAKLDRRWFSAVRKREADGYRSARGVFTMSQFCASSVVKDYSVPKKRVYVVVPGANLTAEVYGTFEDELEQLYYRRASELSCVNGHHGRPLRLVFVGRYLERKGADRLLRAIALGRGRGLRMTLRIIGLAAIEAPPELRGIAGVEWAGLISRRTDNERFCRLLAECDIGCLLSRAEMAGVSIRESLAMGQPVIGPATGGSPDLMPPGTCWQVGPQDSDESIARLLLEIERNVADFELKRATAWQLRREMLWEPAIRRIGQIIAADASER